MALIADEQVYWCLFLHKIIFWTTYLSILFFGFLLKDGDENNAAYATRWSIPEFKERQSNISVFSRVYEEYTDAEHFLEFIRKTSSILFQTSIEIYQIGI